MTVNGLFFFFFFTAIHVLSPLLWTDCRNRGGFLPVKQIIRGEKHTART